jgi:hypothetical protein
MATLGKAWYATCPALTDDNHLVTSPSTKRYNCISWAAGTALRRWDPNVPYFWPKGIDRDARPITLVRLFSELGYVECNSASLEGGFEKIAIYAKDGEWSHAARQKRSGKWTSKLGNLQDIDHDHPSCLEGVEYGKVVAIMKRPRHGSTKKRKARKTNGYKAKRKK